MPKLLFPVVVICFLSSCQVKDNQIDRPNLGKVIVQYAEGFDLNEVSPGVLELKLYNLEEEGGSLMETFWLVSNGSDHKQDSGSKVINIPVKNMACLSTTHVSLLEKAGGIQILSGAAFANRIKNPRAVERVNSGLVTDLSGSEDLDFEKLVDLAPQVFSVYPFGGTDYRPYERAGIQCIPISEYLEKHPLGRAEWLRLFGVLAGNQDFADSVFDSMVSDYNSVMEHAQNMTGGKRPVVFTGSHSGGMWFAPPGKSFISRFIEDAGATYLFADHSEPANVQLQFEELFEKAYDADYWGKVIFEPGELTLAGIQADDERYSNLKSFKEKQVFYCNTAEADYFGDGVVEPEIILRDLAQIFHSKKDSTVTYVYFRPIER